MLPLKNVGTLTTWMDCTGDVLISPFNSRWMAEWELEETPCGLRGRRVGTKVTNHGQICDEAGGVDCGTF